MTQANDTSSYESGCESGFVLISALILVAVLGALGLTYSRHIVVEIWEWPSVQEQRPARSLCRRPARSSPILRSRGPCNHAGGYGGTGGMLPQAEG